MKPRWRWLAVAVVVLGAALTVSAWHKQRPAHQPDVARPGGAPIPSPQAGKPASTGMETGRPPRDRPERERVDRP